MRGKRITPDWLPSRETIDTIKAEFPDLDLRHHHKQFIDHFLSMTGKGSARGDWNASWRVWMRKEGKWSGERAKAASVSRPGVRLLTDSKTGIMIER